MPAPPSAIRKAVFPVAGFGSRNLPATKTVPKEMLPVVDRPLIDYAIREAAAAGIEQFILVTGRNKSAIDDYFDHAYELEDTLAKKGHRDRLAVLLRGLQREGRIVSTRQQQPRGLGHAVWCARHLVGDEPFAVLLADDLMLGNPPCLQELAGVHARLGGNVLATMPVAPQDTARYGMIHPGHPPAARPGPAHDPVPVQGLVEKPAPAEAPSNLAVIGRYILSPAIFDILGRQAAGAGGEIQLTDAMAALVGTQPFHAVRVQARRFDCGSPLGHFEANLAAGLARPDMADGLRRIMARYADPADSGPPARGRPEG